MLTTDPTIQALVLAAIGTVIVTAYLLPTIIAFNRKHHQRGSIAVVNVLFGWTLLGWGIALAWSVSATR